MKRQKKQSLKTVSLIVGLGFLGTIGFGTMWGISANNTYQLKDGSIKGIGVNNYNCTWNKNQQLQESIKPYDSYQSFRYDWLNNDDKLLVSAINTNYNLWISGIVLTSISVLLILLTLVISQLKSLHHSKK